jgi:1,2-diacylglycerol 3-alpha-glucosyltransferase
MLVKLVKLLICTTEYYPHGSGIANVAYNVVEQLKQKGIDCVVCSPTGPDIQLGSRKLILKFGRIGLIYFWVKVHFVFKNSRYDAVWLHQPLFLLKNPFLNSITTMHVTSLGHFRATKKLEYPSYLRFYYFLSSLVEIFSIEQIYNHTRFVVDSPQVGNELSNIKGFDVNYRYIPNGVDTNQFKPLKNRRTLRKELHIPADKIVLIAVGRLSLPKKLFTMIDYFNEVQKKLGNCVLIICGNGELNNKLKGYVHNKGIKNVEFRGFIPNNQLPLWYGCADYYLMSSGYEGQPLTLLEAMASGLPCIVSDIPNLQIVEDANCGIVVNFSNKDTAVKQIIDYIGKDNAEHANNARKYAKENLDWDIIADKYLQEFGLLSQ